MKNILYTLIAICILGLVACDKFLEEKPRSEPSTDDFFQSASDGYASVNILYRKGVSKFLNGEGVYFGSRAMIPGFMSGLFDNGYKGQEQFILHCQDMTIDANVDNAILQELWKDCYEAIVRNANYALKNLPECPGLTDSEKKQLIGEVKFFRAWNYFFLVKLFGPIPVITVTNDKSINEVDLYVRRNTEAKVYNQIVEDLLDAMEAGLTDKPMWDNGYRVSKGSVAALLADVYLNMAGYPVNDISKYAEAAKIAGSLISNSNYALIEHIDKNENSAYNILRTSDSQKEYLYSKEFDKVISNGGWKPVWGFPNEAASWDEFTYSITNVPYDPVSILHAAYDKVNDLRYQEHQYFQSYYTQTKGDNEGVVRDLAGKKPYFWWEPEAALRTNQSEKDLVHYRLAEMYLIAAEAIVKSTGSVNSDAIDYLATIEARASLNKDINTIKSELSVLTPDEFVTEVWTEKIRELIFENKIWNDITRTRMYPSVVSGQFGFVNLIGATNPWGKTFSESKLLLPIPSQEMQRNPALSEPPL